MTRSTTPAPDPEDVRKDLLAALAAGRELGPEMDAAIVDAHLRRHYGEEAEKPQAPAVVERRPLDLSSLALPLSMVIGLVAFIAILAFSRGTLWFLFWPLMAWGWWGWGGHRGRSARYDRIVSRRERRWDRDGYSLNGPSGEPARQSASRHEYD